MEDNLKLLKMLLSRLDISKLLKVGRRIEPMPRPSRFIYICAFCDSLITSANTNEQNGRKFP